MILPVKTKLLGSYKLTNFGKNCYYMNGMKMKTVNISLTQEQYRRVNSLTKKMGFASRSEFFRTLLRNSNNLVFEQPPVKDVKKIVSAFKASGQYNEKFLLSLERGLKESRYFSYKWDMKILPLRPKQIFYLKKQRLYPQYLKQKRLFEQNPRHLSLVTGLLKPKRYKIYSFRLTRSFRVIFIYIHPDTIEVIDINNHYNA